jgi:hypothetical protein
MVTETPKGKPRGLIDTTSPTPAGNRAKSVAHRGLIDMGSIPRSGATTGIPVRMPKAASPEEMRVKQDNVLTRLGLGTQVKESDAWGVSFEDRTGSQKERVMATQTLEAVEHMMGKNLMGADLKEVEQHVRGLDLQTLRRLHDNPFMLHRQVFSGTSAPLSAKDIVQGAQARVTPFAKKRPRPGIFEAIAGIIFGR